MAAGLLLPALAEEPLPDVRRLQTSPILRHLKPNPFPLPPRTPAEKTLAQMYLPEGFRAELVVAEPDLHQPVAFAFDARGRLWVAEAHSYPQKRPPGQGLDKIVVFDDRDGDGQFETRRQFAQGLNLVSGLEIGYGGVWVGAAPELLFIPDRDGDDQPDGPPQVLLDGFGYQDTHECLNSFLWGPDGWLYGNQGVFNSSRIGQPGASDAQRVELRAGVWRYHPVRHQFEVFAEGGSNQWGLDYDERGQIFMTHCRSYWGRGPTTHVVQGGCYWNQANAHYPPFIVANPPPDFPELRNYLLASARYGHGAGGAGKPGSDPIYGGHSHVGTLFYYGDNWPIEYRGGLFTHNLHGHQINHQVNQRLGSGFNTVHSGRDLLFCSDPKYVAVDLQCGPDGAVYIIDWYDQQHCHNPDTERWERASGRIYRVQYQSAYQPRKVDLARLDDVALVHHLGHRNEWFVRTARRLLHERSVVRPVAAAARELLITMAHRHTNAVRRLSALWTLHTIGALDASRARLTLGDPDEYVRAWTIQLLAEDRQVPGALRSEFVRLAGRDPSPVVRLYLASAIQRLPDQTAWQLIEALAQHSEDRDDRNLPLLLWHSMAPRLPPRITRAFEVARRTPIPSLREFIYWYSATLGSDALERSLSGLDNLDSDALRRRLAGLVLAAEARLALAAPPAWLRLASKLYAHDDPRIQRQAERLAAVFGDDSMFPRLRRVLADPGADSDQRRHAFAVLGRRPDHGSLPVFLGLLEEPAFRRSTIGLLARFESAEISRALLDHYETFAPDEQSVALNTLTSRPASALALLEAIDAGRIQRAHLTAFHIRQLGQLRNAEIDRRLSEAWGRITPTPAEKQDRIAKLEKIFDEAPLWAYDAREGRKHFQRLCASCHRLADEGVRLGPELTGAGARGIRYYLENIIDPDAVIGADFQMAAFETRQGDLVSGLLVEESPAAITLRTATEQVSIPKSDIARRLSSEKSLMPEGLLESLTDREQLELLKFLTSN